MNGMNGSMAFEVIRREEYDGMPPSYGEPEATRGAKWAAAIEALRRGETIAIPCASKEELRSVYMSLARSAHKRGLSLHRRWDGQRMAVRKADAPPERVEAAS